MGMTPWRKREVGAVDAARCVCDQPACFIIQVAAQFLFGRILGF
jgi:hypothetical protein